jgi:hypothetical protein
VDKLPYTNKNNIGMSRINDIKEDENVNKLFSLLFDEFGSGAISTLRMLFDTLSACGVGYNGQLEKSGQIGVLDRSNMAMIQRILNDENLNVYVRAWFYRVNINEATNLDIGLLLEDKVVIEKE